MSETLVFGILVSCLHYYKRTFFGDPPFKPLFFLLTHPPPPLKNHIFFTAFPQNLPEKGQQHFVSSSDMFLDKKTLLANWLNPGLNLPTFRGTGTKCFWGKGEERIEKGREGKKPLPPPPSIKSPLRKA